jgi:hypothetical protein
VFAAIRGTVSPVGQTERVSVASTIAAVVAALAAAVALLFARDTARLLHTSQAEMRRDRRRDHLMLIAQLLESAWSAADRKGLEEWQVFDNQLRGAVAGEIGLPTVRRIAEGNMDETVVLIGEARDELRRELEAINTAGASTPWTTRKTPRAEPP